MPAVSDQQQGFMGADLARKRAGKKTKTGMSETQLADFARKKKGKPLPKKKPSRFQQIDDSDAMV